MTCNIKAFITQNGFYLMMFKLNKYHTIKAINFNPESIKKYTVLCNLSDNLNIF